MFDIYKQRQRERPWRRYAIVLIVVGVAGVGGWTLLRKHRDNAIEEDAERSRRERIALEAPHVVNAEGFSFEAPGRVEHRRGDYRAGIVQGGGRSTGFGAMWNRELSLDDNAHRADVVARVRNTFQRAVEAGVERRINIAGAQGYAIELRSRDAFPYVVELTMLECDHRLVALWIDRESSVADQNQAMLASYRCPRSRP